MVKGRQTKRLKFATTLSALSSQKRVPESPFRARFSLVWSQL
jgi:hypothetical protein